MKKLRKNWVLILILILGIFLRFYKINSIPPINNEILANRLLSAFLGSFSILYLYILGNSLFNNKKISLYISLFYAILPINLVENRIVSWISGANFAVIAILILLYQRKKYYKYFAILLVFIIIVVFIPNYLILTKPVFSLTKIITNSVNFLSFNKIFFNNDSYWIGGIRKYGFIYPELIPIFLIGTYNIIKNKKLILLLPSLIILLVSINPKYPEAREAGLISPFLSITLGLGFYQIYEKFKLIKGLSVKLLIGIYILLVFYSVFNFLHRYQTHYFLQVRNENLYYKYKF